MKVVLIRPPALIKPDEIALFATPPIGLAYIAGSVRESGFECQFIDAVGEDFSSKTEVEGGKFLAFGLTPAQITDRIAPDAAVIGVSCQFTKEWRSCYRWLLEHIRQMFPEAIVVCGGEHITAEPVSSMQQSAAIDICVLGEGEETTVDLLRAIAASGGNRSALSASVLEKIDGIAYRNGGDVVITQRRGRVRKIDDIALPAWDLTPIRNYIDERRSFGVARGRTMPMLASRGCPYRCTFCSSPLMWTQRWLARDADKVLDEIEYYMNEYGATNFDFYDLTAIVRRDWIIEFATKVMARNLKITWQLPSGTRSEAIDGEVCELLFKSGCRNVSYSPESGSVSVLKRIEKKVQPERLLDSIRGAVQAGMNVKVNLIFGFPDETEREIWESLRFVFRLAVVGAHDLSIWSFAPYPGTALYRQLRDSGKIVDFDDEYIDTLIYADLNQSKTWNAHMPVERINLYRKFGMLIFYGTALLLRPYRLFISVRNIRNRTYESRSEQFIGNLLHAKKQA